MHKIYMLRWDASGAGRFRHLRRAARQLIAGKLGSLIIYYLLCHPIWPVSILSDNPSDIGSGSGNDPSFSTERPVAAFSVWSLRYDCEMVIVRIVACILRAVRAD